MSVDDTKIACYSGWDIDQLITSAEVSVGSGATALSTIPSGATLPVFEVQFKPTGSTYWYQEGRNSSDGTLANLFDFYSYLSGGSVYINAPSAGTARYFIWSDKLDY